MSMRITIKSLREKEKEIKRERERDTKRDGLDRWLRRERGNIYSSTPQARLEGN